MLLLIIICTDERTILIFEFGFEPGTRNPDRRRGILVLINDSDWELEGEGDYQLKAGDEIVFISTLHGG